MTTLRSNSDERARQRQNILTILKYFSIDWIKKTCWKEIVNLAGYEVTTLIEAVEASDNSISGMLLATGEFVQCGYQSHMALFPLLKTARVASGENSLSSALSVSSNLLTGSMAYCLQSQSFSEEKYLLTNSQVAELWKIRDTNLNTIPILTEMRALLLNSSVILVIKGLGGKLVALSF
jgi:hypothetical protein